MSQDQSRHPNQLERYLLLHEHRRRNPLPPWTPRPNDSLELQQKNPNVSPRGCFYEKAKSRNNRAKEVFRCSRDRKALVSEALLGFFEEAVFRFQRPHQAKTHAIAKRNEGKVAMRKRIKPSEDCNYPGCPASVTGSRCDGFLSMIFTYFSNLNIFSNFLNRI